MPKTFFLKKKNVLLVLFFSLIGLVLAWSLIELFRASERQAAEFEDDIFFGQNEESIYQSPEDKLPEDSNNLGTSYLEDGGSVKR